MMRTIGIMLAVALIAFVGCGMVMMCMEFAAHYTTITGGIPVASATAVLAMVALMAIAPWLAPALNTPRISIRRRLEHPPAFSPPLRLAFSDGLLNPRPF